MCYPAPGPRCSAHARQALARTDRDFQAAVAAYSAACGDRTIPDTELTRRRATQDQAQAAVVAAQDDYDATPAGQRDLEVMASDLYVQLSLASDENKRVLMRSLADVQARLDAGRRRRAAAKASMAVTQALNERDAVYERWVTGKEADPVSAQRNYEAACARVEDAEHRYAGIASGSLAPTDADLAEAPRRPIGMMAEAVDRRRAHSEQRAGERYLDRHAR